MNLTRDEAARRSATVDLDTCVVDLDLTGALDPQVPGFPARTTLTFTLRDPDGTGAPAASTFLDFVGESVSQVTVDGAPLDPGQVWDGARIRLDNLATGTPVTVMVEAYAAYSRTGQGLHRFVDPADGQTYLYSHLEPTDARRVFACFEQPDLKARTTLHVWAPAGWRVLANQRAHSVEPVDPADPQGAQLHRFPPTQPLSTYLTAVVAGPYVGQTATWSRDGVEVPLGVWCRASLAEHMDADWLFEVTRAGLDFFHDAFAYPYPWGSYDQVFVPEYNIGAMENPGCVTFNEDFLHRSAPTSTEQAALTNTMLHEMAHMWFGDLVTPAWWDDLWLKESFAEYMGAAAAVETGRTPEAWVSFAGSRKEWAYAADQMPTTHPIAADIVDLEAARQNFDGITYAKGASVLKQLVAYVGAEAFYAGARTYFQRHAFGATRLEDLLTVLEESSGRDLSEWVDQWLHTSGVDTLHVELGATAADLVLGPDDAFGAEPAATTGAAPAPSRLVRTSPDDTRRAHRVAVGVYEPDAAGTLRRTGRVEVDLTGEEAELAEWLQIPRGDDGGLAEGCLLLPNDDDLTYARIRLDPVSRATALDAVGAIADPLAQAQVWSALWNDVRDGRLRPQDYLSAVVEQAGTSPSFSAHVGDQPLILPRLLAQAATALVDYVPAELRPDVAGEAFDTVWERLVDAVGGSDQQLTWARAACTFGAEVGEDYRDDALTRLSLLLDGPVPDGLEVSPDLRWQVVRAMAAQGGLEGAELAAEGEADPSARGRRELLAATVGTPDEEIKLWAWEQLHASPTVLSNDEFDAVVAGFTVPSHRILVEGYASTYWTMLERIWAQHPAEIATRLVRGLFPNADLEMSDPHTDPPVLSDARAWLADHADAPHGLRRLLIEQLDAAERIVRVQRATMNAQNLLDRAQQPGL